MKDSRKFLLLFICLLPCLLLCAQETERTETKEVWLRVSGTYKLKDTIIATLSGGKDIGLVKGQLLKAHQNSLPEVPGVSPKRELRENGSGFIVFDDSIPYAFIRLYASADTLEAGDLISLKLTVPYLPYRSIFSQLAFNNQLFTDNEKNPLYSLKYLLRNDSPQTEDSLFNLLVQNLHDTYEVIKNNEDLPKILKQTIAAGRLKGKIPLEIYRDATSKEVKAFFQYILAYPVGYMGKNFRFSESIAGWLISNSPYSTGEVKAALYPLAKNKTMLLKILPEYKTDILKEGMVQIFVGDAIGLSNKYQFSEAHALADFALQLGEMLNDTVGKATAYIGKAQIFLDQEKYVEAISFCDKAIKESVKAGDKDIEMQAILKKGFCLFKVSRSIEADAILVAAKRKLDIYKPLISDYYYRRDLMKIYEYRSSIKYNMGQYDKSLSLLDTAIAINNEINSYDANIKNAQFYTFIGQLNNEQGKPADALQAFEKAALIYRNSNDKLNKANVETEIGYSYYQLGEYRKGIDVSQKAMKVLVQEGDDNNAGYAMSLAGSSYYSLGQYDSALAAHNMAISLRRKSGNKKGQAFSWSKIGELYQLSGSKIMALQAFDSAMHYYQLVKDSAGLAEVYTSKGDAFLSDENYKRATEWFEKANGIRSKSTVEALYKLGSAWFSIDTARSGKYFRSARDKSKQDGNTAYEYYANRSLALLAYRSLDIVTGDQYYNECVALSSEMKTATSKAYCISLKAVKYENLTELDSALLYYSKAMQITDTVEKSESIISLNNMANLYLSKGEFAQADSVLTKAIKMAKDISDSLSLGNTLQSSSFLYSRTAEFEKGLFNSDSAISIFKKSGHQIRLANAYSSRGTLLSSMGENKQSVLAYLYADSLYKQELQVEDRGIIFNNIGIVYMAQGDYTTALKYLQQSIAILKKGKITESYLLTQGNIAECLKGLNKASEAKALLQDILPKAQQLKLNRVASGMALVLGKILLEENNLSRASEYFLYAKEYAAASGEQDKLIEALISLGRIYSKVNKLDMAKESLQQSVALTRKYKIISAWDSYYELGLLYYNQQQSDSAIVYFKQAVDLLDKSMENLYGGEEAKKLFNNDARKADLYNKITFAYYNVGNIKEAWGYANRSNIAGIKELSGSLSVNSNDAEKNEALKKLLAMQQSKKALENTLEKQDGAVKQATLKKIEILEADYNNFLQDVVAEYPELSTYFSRSNADEFNNYKGKLPDDVAVALYLLNDKTLMIFTLTNEKLAVDTMTIDIAPKIADFIAAIKNVNKQTGTGALSERADPADEDKATGTGDFKDLSDELYAALITTVGDKIGHKQKLCIIPTGVFSNMPFQCLGRKTTTNSFRFLVEDHAIFYTAKMSIFNSPARKEKVLPDLKSFAAFGVPDATLRYNIAEVRSIGKILGADSTVYTDGRATESMAKKSLRSKKYIHFATHGVLNYSSDYSQSYLKLLPDKDTSGGNNGQLTMREVQKLGITDCDLVILSACQTAVSKELVKGWSISPANSFLISNVKSVVAGLWKVADEPTQLLLEYYIENLEQRKMGMAEALRQAQIRLSQDERFRHPNYWGAFVLYGEWR